MKHKYDDTDIDIEYIKNRINPRTRALKVALTYGLVVGVSIFLINRFMVLALDDMKIGHKIAIIKDEVFVAITMLILYVTIRRQMTLLKKSIDKVYDGYRELDIANEQLSATKELLKENFETLNQHQYEQIKLQERLWHQRNLSKSIINDAGAIILMWHLDGSTNIFNPFAEEITGYKASEILGKRWIDSLIPPEDREHMQFAFDRILEGDLARHENRIICKNGKMIDILWSNSILRDKDGNISEIISIGTDITERKEMEKRLHMMAYYDTLTGLPNRIMIEEKFNKFLSGHNDDGFKAAIMILDIDNFKNINETLGHNVGDMLLKNVANVLTKYIKLPDMLGRISGDGFIIVLNNMQDVNDIIWRVMDIQQYLKRTWYADGREIFVSTSVGIALYPYHGKDASILIKNASTAMLHVKERSKDDYAFYIKDMEKNAFERMEMLNMLCSAIEKQEFSLYYQPQVDIKTGKIVGAEALIRWTHPEKGGISPADFIPIAEQGGLIGKIDKWVIKEVFWQKKIWDEKGYKDVELSLNISAKTLMYGDLIEYIKSLIEGMDVSKDYICFEITETALLNDWETAISVINDLRSMGFKVALDDFGTGHSSLTYLKKLPIDVLKIDRQFINDIDKSNDGEGLISPYIIQMAHALKLKVVAEGVETPKQLKFLEDHGCDICQGYIFSKPILPKRIEEMF